MKWLFKSLVILLLMIPYTSLAQHKPMLIGLESKSLTQDFRDVKYTPFDPSRFIFPVVEKNDVTGIPKSLSDYKVLHSFADRNQFFFQSVKDGSMKEDVYAQMEDIYEDAHTDQWLDAIVSVVIGNEDGQLKLYVDSNNDENFSDEPPLSFKEQKNTQGKLILTAQSNISIEYFENGKVKTRNLDIRFILPDSTKYESLMWHTPTFREGTISINDRTYHIALGAHPTYRPGFYYFFYVDLNRDGKFDTQRGGLESYSLSEPFNLGGVGLKIDQLAQDGSSLNLLRVEEEVLPKTVIKPGIVAPQFETKTIDDEPFDLSKFRGRYVLLDFWESKCPYCLKEIDHLKKAYNQFKDNLTVVGVAADSDMGVLRKFLSKHQIGWVQISASLNSDLATLYSVYGFPTQYLIGKDGVILETGSNLRGEKLTHTLSKYIR